MIVFILFATTLSSLCSTGSKDTSPWKRNLNSFAMDQIDVNDCNWPQHEWQHSVFVSNPNIGMLVKLGNETCSICTATIVGKSKMFGITAAHCFFNLHNNEEETFVFWTGIHKKNLSQNNETLRIHSQYLPSQRMYHIESWAIPSRYRGRRRGWDESQYDFAVFKLSSPCIQATETIALVNGQQWTHHHGIMHGYADCTDSNAINAINDKETEIITLRRLLEQKELRGGSGYLFGIQWQRVFSVLPPRGWNRGWDIGMISLRVEEGMSGASWFIANPEDDGGGYLTIDNSNGGSNGNRRLLVAGVVSEKSGSRGRVQMIGNGAVQILQEFCEETGSPGDIDYVEWNGKEFQTSVVAGKESIRLCSLYCNSDLVIHTGLNSERLPF